MSRETLAVISYYAVLYGTYFKGIMDAKKGNKSMAMANIATTFAPQLSRVVGCCWAFSIFLLHSYSQGRSSTMSHTQSSRCYGLTK
ncbi:uncharacterized protein BCR38DRAFT_450906 [Pseudomassariella vexata]|uniref:Uncharacterized protein n=1 Tax=Pseudomassariella vexata TaxID=1141098 RepID=A0A1Y2DDC5_9PEZI|nr:uncharacterized protein BCR38DRAFT_450906 [Pseudomassariella vexata]ORY56695.1 hypothetical protein BCR38DRAFT_450906 [Pseudomassariella vexata]